MVEKINVGDLITDDPTNKEDFYKVKSIHVGFVKALHAHGKTVLKVFPEEILIRDNWWVEDHNLAT